MDKVHKPITTQYYRNDSTEIRTTDSVGTVPNARGKFYTKSISSILVVTAVVVVVAEQEIIVAIYL
jgi:hypothetical protein